MLWEKVAQTPRLNLFFFLGLGWPWVGEFVGFIKIVIMFFNPTEFGVSQGPYFVVVSMSLCQVRGCCTAATALRRGFGLGALEVERKSVGALG